MDEGRVQEREAVASVSSGGKRAESDGTSSTDRRHCLKDGRRPKGNAHCSPAMHKMLDLPRGYDIDRLLINCRFFVRFSVSQNQLKIDRRTFLSTLIKNLAITLCQPLAAWRRLPLARRAPWRNTRVFLSAAARRGAVARCIHSAATPPEVDKGLNLTLYSTIYRFF